LDGFPTPNPDDPQGSPRRDEQWLLPPNCVLAEGQQLRAQGQVRQPDHANQNASQQRSDRFCDHLNRLYRFSN